MRHSSPHAGHTLIEILLALGLSLIILAAAYAALDQHWRYADTGQRQTERMQVTRALFERISLDVRSVVFRPDGSVAETDAPGIKFTQSTETRGRQNLGIVGDSQKLVMQIVAPNAHGLGGGQTIRWMIHPFESRHQETGILAKSPTADSQSSGRGLFRIARNQTLLDAAANVLQEDLLAAEVKTIRFRYFAQGTWTNQWDSVKQQRLPRAVEVTIGFRQEATATPTSRDQSELGEYRLLIPVPTSEA